MENLGEILQRLAAAGITRPPPSSDVSPGDGDGHVCDTCAGRGWYTPDVPVGHPEFGRVVTCHCNEERLEEERLARLLRYSNLGSLTRFTFEGLRPTGLSDDPDNQRLFSAACQAALRYAESPRGWLVLLGPNGAGKTHLAAAIASRCIERGLAVLFMHVPDLLDHLRAAYAPTSEVSYSELFEQVKAAPVLILDGLGSQASTPWATEKLHQIINHRYNAELPTVVTTALRLEEMDAYLAARLATPGLSRTVEVRTRTPQPALRLGRIEPAMLQRMTFETFEARGNGATPQQRASLDAALRAARNFAADPDGWLTLFGEPGVGKTHLAIAIAGQHLAKGNPVFFAFVPELMDYLRYTFNPESRFTYDQVFEGVKGAPLLVLDDLGQEHSTPWAYEKLYQIIVHRHNARLPTVVTSKDDFTSQAGPISSRLQDPSVGQIIRMDAPDFRNKKRRK